MTTETYERFFERVTTPEAQPVRRPHEWQQQLGRDPVCRDRLVRIPTGFGKTAGVTLPWLFHRVVRADDSWPRRLLLTLPMRVLVEQTELAVNGWIERAGLDVGVHVLMGGSDAGDWHLYPERPAVLIGTQDMLLSRALNRGYGAARGRWPIDFALLHHDALWVLDEVQLMDVGLATSVQLGQFRRDEAPRALRPSHAWWMSATLQPRWLQTADAGPHTARLEEEILSIPASARSGGLWEVKKPLTRRTDATTPKEIAAVAAAAHGPKSLTLVIVNRVPTALEVHREILAAFSEGRGSKARPRDDAPEVELVHSRFRGAEREVWKRFLTRDSEMPANGRVVVATQVVEAGVDISAETLVTELAPWPSLVQRFGRCARYPGDTGAVIVVGGPPKDDRAALPYDAASLSAASALLDEESITDVAPRALEALEEKLDPSRLAALYPYAPLHVLRRPDLDELFDTAPDLSGADLDVSRYIRSGDERDVAIFWRDGRDIVRGRPTDPPPRQISARALPSPTREELCRAPLFPDVRDWLKGRVAYVRDYRENAWVRLSNDQIPRKVHPGTIVLVEAAEGGYDPKRGWDPKSKAAIDVLRPQRDAPLDERTAAGEDDDELSELEWQTIDVHGREAGAEAHAIAATLQLPPRLRELLDLAGRWHDVGKAHAVFQGAIRDDARHAQGGIALGRDLAKAPSKAWRPRPPYPERPGFRHELASTIALLELLRRADPMHAALLGPHVPLLRALGEEPDVPEPIDRDHPLARELCALSGSELDLVAYLVCAHHGKVRCTWMSTAKDQERGSGAIHGVCEGDEVPATAIRGAEGSHELPPMTLSLAPAVLGVGSKFGASWVERVTGLLAEHGPFALAFLESVLRAADVRVSKRLEGAGGPR